MRALIVEPSRFLRSVISSIFSSANIIAIQAESAAEALVLLAEEPCDILCFAQQLREGTGLNLLQQVKAAHPGHAMVSLMVSSDLTPARLEEAALAGVTEAFSKAHLDALEAFVKRFAESRQSTITGHVLLVEDSIVAAKFCLEVINRLGLTADLFDCAEEALKSLATTRYDLVLTDYLLAGQGTGLSLIRAIRSENNHGAPLSILAMSSMDDPARKIEILRAGANDFVVKPILKEELEVRIRNLLTMKQLFDRLNDQHQAMRELSLRDPLTSLHNRYHLMEQVPKIIETARQTKKPLSMLVIDIDHFKVVNDTYGHSTGDVVLVNTSEALRGFISNNMLLVRYGGEEFVMLFPGVNLRQAMAGAERIRERLASLNPGGIPITASFGAAEWHPDESFDELFRRADACVYEAKAGGRNQVVGK